MKKRKKIVHLISSLKIGGAESLLYDLILGLGSDRYDHHVVCFHQGPHGERLKAAGIPVHHVHGFIGMYDPLFFWRAWRIISSLKPDVIHTSLWAANFVGRIIGYAKRIPVLSVVHLGVNLDGRVRNNLDAFTFNLATRVVAVSDGVAESMSRQFTSLPSHKVTVVKNGINGQAIIDRASQQRVSRQDLGLSEGQFVIGAVGRFVERKKFDLLIESFAIVHQHSTSARLLLLGVGPRESFLRSQVRKMGLENEVVFVTGKQAYGYYPLFDCFALPSSQEGLSIALLEALCCQLPCIVTAPDKKHEVIINDYNGFVVEPDNPQQLSQAFVTLLRDKNAKRTMSVNASKTISEDFSFGRMIGAYREELEAIMR